MATLNSGLLKIQVCSTHLSFRMLCAVFLSWCCSPQNFTVHSLWSWNTKKQLVSMWHLCRMMAPWGVGGETEFLLLPKLFCMVYPSSWYSEQSGKKQPICQIWMVPVRNHIGSSLLKSVLEFYHLNSSRTVLAHSWLLHHCFFPHECAPA